MAARKECTLSGKESMVPSANYPATKQWYGVQTIRQRITATECRLFNKESLLLSAK